MHTAIYFIRVPIFSYHHTGKLALVCHLVWTNVARACKALPCTYYTPVRGLYLTRYHIYQIHRTRVTCFTKTAGRSAPEKWALRGVHIGHTVSAPPQASPPRACLLRKLLNWLRSSYIHMWTSHNTARRFGNEPPLRHPQRAAHHSAPIASSFFSTKFDEKMPIIIARRFKGRRQQDTGSLPCRKTGRLTATRLVNDPSAFSQPWRPLTDCGCITCAFCRSPALQPCATDRRLSCGRPRNT